MSGAESPRRSRRRRLRAGSRPRPPLSAHRGLDDEPGGRRATLGPATAAANRCKTHLAAPPPPSARANQQRDSGGREQESAVSRHRPPAPPEPARSRAPCSGSRASSPRRPVRRQT
jgi:hypothetical protein